MDCFFLARNHAFSLYFDLNILFRARKVELSRNGPLGSQLLKRWIVLCAVNKSVQ